MRALCVAVAAAFCASSAAAQPAFDLLPSNEAQAPYILARGVSGDGRVIGGSSAIQAFERPYVWRREGDAWMRTQLPVEGGFGWGRPVALSYDGDAIAGMTNRYLSGALGGGTPALWSGVLSGAPTLVSPFDDGPQPPLRGVFGGISGDGAHVTGWTRVLNPPSSPGVMWSYAAGTAAQLSPQMTTDSYINGVLSGNTMSGDGSVIVGSRQIGQDRVAFRWTEVGGFEDLITPANLNSDAEVVSRDGRVIGGYLPDSGVTYNGTGRPALWTDEGLIQLGRPTGGPTTGRVYALSGDGSIAGGVLYQSSLTVDGTFFGNATAVLWVDLLPIRLSDYVADLGLELQGLTPRVVTGISDDGNTIVGFGSLSTGGLSSFVLTVPPPATLTALGMGLLASARRRPHRRPL